MTSESGRFTLRRGEHSYGPYTLAEMSAYVATGNMVSTDAIFDHETQTWTTVDAVLRSHGVTPPATIIPPPLSIGAEMAPGGLAPGESMPGSVVIPGMVAAGSRRGEAVAALVLGIFSIACCGPLTGIIAIVLGARAMKDPPNRGLATAGLVLGIIGTALGTLGIIIQLLATVL